MDATLKATEKLLGYVTVNPMFPESMEDLSLLKSNPKFRGVKIHPDYHGYDVDSPMARRFLDAVAPRTPLMLCHVSCMPGTGFAAAPKIAALASRHPKTMFIMAHIAGIFQNPNYPYFPNFEGLEHVASLGLKNVFVDTAHHLMYVYPGVMEKMVEVLGAKSIVFGTDCPLQGHRQMRFALEIIQSLPVSQGEKDQILFSNAQTLLGIP